MLTDAVLIFFLCCIGALSINAQVNKSHVVSIDHPALKGGETYNYELLEHSSGNNELPGYQLHVDSVICIEDICKIIPVSLFWDFLGNFKSYRLQKNHYLEKKEGVKFTEQDYKKLEEILKDKKSPFRNLKYHQITHKKVYGEGEIDAFTGATAVPIAREKSIEGAAWTCFTLWHWVNGEVLDHISTISGAKATLNQLEKFLSSDEKQERLFAIKELGNRKMYTDKILRDCRAILKNNSSDTELELVLDYVEKLPEKVFLDTMKIVLFECNSTRTRQVILRSLLNSRYRGESAYYNEIFEGVYRQNPDYKEIDILFLIFEKISVSSTELNNRVTLLLDHKNFLIARRSYWWLEKQSLEVPIQEKVTLFYEKYKNKL